MKTLKRTAKKTLAIVLTLALVLSLPLCINAATVNTAVTGEVITGSCGADGDNVTYTLDTETGVLTVSGTGYMADYSYGEIPWFDVKETITSVVISLYVESIGDCAFEDCTSLTSIVIPVSVWRIGYSAFKDCTGLTSIVIPEGVGSIGDCAFEDCTGLTSIVIPDGVTSIGYSAFKDCTGLTSIEIPESVTNIGDYTFYGCSGLTNIKIPEGVGHIGRWAFGYCEGLTGIKIPESLTSIGEYAFGFCIALTSIEIPEGVTSIGQNAFYESVLTSIEIPKSVTSIGKGAFDRCPFLLSINVNEENKSYSSIDGVLYNYDKTSLIRCPMTKSSIEIPESVTNIGEGAFRECGLISIEIPKTVTSIGSEAFLSPNLRAAYIYNKDVAFDSNAFYDYNLAIYGYKNSTAQTYAEDNSIYFIALDGEESKADLILSYNNGQADGEFNYDSDYTVSFSELSAPQKDNSVFTGWYLDSECTISAGNQVTVLKGEKKTLYAGWKEVGDAIEAEADDDMSYVGTTSEFDLFGAQFREQTNSYTTGLRFCTRVSKSLISEIEAKTGSPAESGYVLSAKDNVLSDTKLEVGAVAANGKTVKENPAPIRYYDGEGYYVYTAVIVNIPDDMQSTDIVARPYIKYTDANGVLRYYYFTESGESNCGGGYYTSYTAVYNAYLAAQG